MNATTLLVCGRRYRGVVMETFLDRLLGVHRAPSGTEVVVIPGAAVHGMTLARPLTYVAIHEESDVCRSSILDPGRFVRIRGAVAIAEFPDGLICQAHHDSHRIRWLR